MIQPLGLSTQIDLDVEQRLAVGKLSKGPGQKLVHAGQILNLVIAAVNGNAAAKRAQRQERHELRENKLSWFIAILCVQTQKTMSHRVEVQIETRQKL